MLKKMVIWSVSLVLIYFIVNAFCDWAIAELERDSYPRQEAKR